MENGFQLLWGLATTVRGLGMEPAMTSGLGCQEPEAENEPPSTHN